MKKVPYGAAGLYLLGQVRELQSKRKEAVKNYRKALELDPTLWCAYERLCVLEPGESAGSFFTEDHIYIQRMNGEIMREFEVYNDLSQHQPLGVHSSPPTQQNNYMMNSAQSATPVHMMPPPSRPLNDSKENICYEDKKVPGPSFPAPNS